MVPIIPHTPQIDLYPGGLTEHISPLEDTKMIWHITHKVKLLWRAIGVLWGLWPFLRAFDLL